MKNVMNTIYRISKDNNEIPNKAEEFLKYYLNFDTIEIGGSDFSPDYTWLSVKDDTILIVNCGVLG